MPGTDQSGGHQGLERAFLSCDPLSENPPIPGITGVNTVSW
jgi:hypothetical protein